MTQEAGTPAGFWDRVEAAAERAVAKYIRAGLLNSSSITNGQGLRVGAGSKFIVQHPDGMTLMLVGIYDVNHTLDLTDGSYQPVYMLRRQDGSLAMSMYDPLPGSGGYNQFLAWWDRQGHVIISDDTDSGFGHARPWLSNAFTAVRYGDLRYTTTSATFETVCDALVNRQQPRWEVGIRASMDTPGATGEVRVLVDGQQLGSTSTEAFAVTTRYYGPSTILGTYGQDALVEVQARVTSGTGGLRLEPRFCRTRQS